MTSTSSLHEAGQSKLVLWDNSEGKGGEGGGRGVQDGGAHVYLWPTHVDVWQKPSQYCNYLPIKINKFLNKERN